MNSSIVACGKFKGGCHKTTPYKIKPSIFNLGTLALVNFLIIWLLHVNFTPGWMNGMPVSEPLAFMLGAVTQLPELVRGVSHQLLAVICGSLGWWFSLTWLPALGLHPALYGSLIWLPVLFTVTFACITGLFFSVLFVRFPRSVCSFAHLAISSFFEAHTKWGGEKKSYTLCFSLNNPTLILNFFQIFWSSIIERALCFCTCSAKCAIFFRG